MSVVQHWPGLLIGFVLVAGVSSSVFAQEVETPQTAQNVPAVETPAPPAGEPAPPAGEPAPPTGQGAPAAGEAPPDPDPGAASPAGAPSGSENAPPGVEGPLFTVAPEGEPLDDAQQVREIYRESDQTFVNVLWWWVVLIAVLAGAGYGAWMLWGRRQPRPPSGR